MEPQQRIKKQLINQKRQYIQNFQSLLQHSKYSKNLKEYSIISIIGVQGSGKSTLLNSLFGTSFQVLTQVRGNRTTKGIWISLDIEKPIIVLDVEGNDSIQNQDPNYEKTVAMFALTLSNLLIVNVWAKSLGTNSGSQYGILKILMQMSLKLFKHQSKKTILFCVRDFDSLDINEVSKKIIQDVIQIWKKVVKPPQYSNYQYDRFFRVKVHPLRRYRKVDPKNFEQDVKKLRIRLVDNNDQDYIFKELDYSFNLPIGDLPNLSKSAWTSIMEQKQFNLPNQKVQISNFRSSSIKIDVIDKFEVQLQTLKDSLNNNEEIQVGKKLEQIIEQNMQYYSNQVNYYDKKVVTEKKKELMQCFNEKVSLFVEQLAKIDKQKYIDKFTSLNSQHFDQKPNLKIQLQKRFNQTINKYEQQLKRYKYNFPLKKQFIRNLQITLKSNISNIETRQYQLLKSDNFNLNSRLISEKVSQLLSNVNQYFWQQSQVLYQDIIKKSKTHYQNKYNWIYDTAPPNHQVQQIINKIYNSYKQQIKQTIQTSLAQRILIVFKQIFLKNQQGIARNWTVMTINQIQQVFQSSRDETIQLVKTINTVPSLNKSIVNDSQQISQDLLDENKLGNLLSDAQNKMTEQYQKIKRIKIESQMSKIPFYYWIILLFFIYDDIVYGASFPIIYYPSILIFSICGLFLATNKTKHLISYLHYILEKLKKRFKILR